MIARAEFGQARDNMVDFDVAEVAHGIHELYEPLAEDKGLILAVRTVSATVHGNRELVNEALANLVENAIKYGISTGRLDALGSLDVVPEEPDILIEARFEADMVLLSVTDHGPAIPRKTGFGQ